MNPKEFCQLDGYDSCLMLTYSFDPLFFERLVLPDLWSSGSSDILICADAFELEATKSRWPGQVMHLGRRYQVRPVAVGGAFHPKLILKVGREGGAAWVGSANVTFSGWSANWELGTAWGFGPSYDDDGAWVTSVLNGLRSRGVATEDSPVIERILDQDWLPGPETTTPTGSQAVLSTLIGTNLAYQLAERWAGRRFREAKICTGSSDVEGRLLSWLHESFGITHATVLGDPGRLRFSRSELDKLPLAVDVRTIGDTPPRPMHAKFIWLQGQDDSAACFGSANCSAAAWLLDPQSNGNDELIVAFDRPSRDDFSDSLSIFERNSAPVEIQVGREEIAEPKRTAIGLRVKQASWEPSTGQLVIYLAQAIGEDVQVRLDIEGKETPCFVSEYDRSILIAEGNLAGGIASSIFGKLIAQHPSGEKESHLVWLNHLGDLRHASGGRGIAEAMRGITRSRTNSERLRYLKSLHQLSSELLSNPQAYQDPRHLLVSPESARPDRSSEPAEAIDPRELVKSLEEVQLAEPTNKSTVHSRSSLSLTGVFRFLFQNLFEEELDSEFTQADEAREDLDDSDPGGSEDKRQKDRDPSQDPIADQDHEEVTDRVKRQLCAQVDEFISRLESHDFAENCTVTQLVQAVAYVLGLTAIAKRDGWASDEIADAWSRKVIKIALIKPYKSDPGLLGYVMTRYESENNVEAFLRIVGDGTLWAAFLAVLANMRWAGPGGSLEHALMLSDIFRDQKLLASTDSGKLRFLVDNDQLMKLESALSVVPKIDRSLGALEDRLVEMEVRRGEPERNTPEAYEEGDLMWRQSSGWAICRSTTAAGHRSVPAYLHGKGRDAKLVYGWYWNVTAIAKNDLEVSDLIHRVVRLVRSTS